MKSERIMWRTISVAFLCSNIAWALPQNENRKLKARQDIDFELVNSTPDPDFLPDDNSDLSPTAAIASVIADINTSPLPQPKRALAARDTNVATYAGYTSNTPIGSAALNAPLDCNKQNTFMGAKMFTATGFDTTLCAAACSAQSAYNLRHPPANGPAQTCQFYNTYAMYKNDVYQGQYCSLYNQTWDTTYATNTGQVQGVDHYTIQDSYIASNSSNPGVCPQAQVKRPLDLTKTIFNHADNVNIVTNGEKNLATIAFRGGGNTGLGVSTQIFFPVVANEIYEISFDYFQQIQDGNIGRYFIEVGDGLPDNWHYEATLFWTQVAGRKLTPVSYYNQAIGGQTGYEMNACWNSKVVPQVAPASGVWNSGKVILKPRTNSGYFRWDFSEELSLPNSLQWKNVYVTKMATDYCKAGT